MVKSHRQLKVQPFICQLYHNKARRKSALKVSQHLRQSDTHGYIMSSEKQMSSVYTHKCNSFNNRLLNVHHIPGTRLQQQARQTCRSCSVFPLGMNLKARSAKLESTPWPSLLLPTWPSLSEPQAQRHSGSSRMQLLSLFVVVSAILNTRSKHKLWVKLKLQSRASELP